MHVVLQGHPFCCAVLMLPHEVQTSTGAACLLALPFSKESLQDRLTTQSYLKAPNRRHDKQQVSECRRLHVLMLGRVSSLPLWVASWTGTRRRRAESLLLMRLSLVTFCRSDAVYKKGWYCVQEGLLQCVGRGQCQHMLAAAS